MFYDDDPLNTIPIQKAKVPRGAFLDAEEAYKATNEIIGEYDTTEIQDLKDQILDAIKYGKFRIIVYHSISDLAKEYFENKNYKIIENDDRYGYFVKISWNRTERV